VLPLHHGGVNISRKNILSDKEKFKGKSETPEFSDISVVSAVGTYHQDDLVSEYYWYYYLYCDDLFFNTHSRSSYKNLELFSPHKL
jgi:hypothetical protein